MKNVNLTQIYLDLIKNCDVIGFELHSIRKIDSLEPTDAEIKFYPRDTKTVNKVNLDEIKEIVINNYTGNVKHLDVKINVDAIVVYIEFEGHDTTHWDVGL